MKLSRISIIYRSFQSLTAIILLALIFGGGLTGSGLSAVAAWIFFTLFLVSAVVSWQYLVWRNYDYFLEEGSLDISHGVISRKRREIPWGRVQNVDISRTLVQRFLGIAKVNFETAGGGATEASLRYVRYERAQEIQRKVRRLKREAETEEESQEDYMSELLFELGFRELVLMSFFSVNLGIVFTALVVVSVLGSTGVLTGVGTLAIYVITLLVLAGLWVSRAATTFARFFDFKLHRSEDALEYEHGLFNRESGSIPLDKVQSLKLEENPLKRFFNYSTLKVETAGYSPVTAAEKGSEVAIPLATRQRSIEFARKIRDFEDLDYTRIPRRARRRYIGRYSIGLSVLLALGFAVDHYVYSVNYWLLLSLVPLIPVAAHYKRKNRGYSLGEEHLFTVNGFWNRTTAVVPYYRMQNLIQSETILQRRWRLATLTFDTAGTSILDTGIKVVDGGRQEVKELREEVYDSFRGSL